MFLYQTFAYRYEENHEIENITMTVLSAKLIRVHFDAFITQYPNLFTRVLVQKFVCKMCCSWTIA